MSATEVIHEPGWIDHSPRTPVKSITIAPAKPSPSRSETVERWVQVLIMVAIGGAAGAGSFRRKRALMNPPASARSIRRPLRRSVPVRRGHQGGLVGDDHELRPVAGVQFRQHPADM